jgi:hypothetical protein
LKYPKSLAEIRSSIDPPGGGASKAPRSHPGGKSPKDPKDPDRTP